MMRLDHLFPDHKKKTNKQNVEIAGGRKQGSQGSLSFWRTKNHLLLTAPSLLSKCLLVKESSPAHPLISLIDFLEGVIKSYSSGANRACRMLTQGKSGRAGL